MEQTRLELEAQIKAWELIARSVKTDRYEVHQLANVAEGLGKCLRAVIAMLPGESVCE
jgi:hypothetical protein